jgi:uncharacterized membrane protein
MKVGKPSIFICILWALILIPISLIEGIVRVIVSIPFLLFVPGYVLISALFPSKEIDFIERIALSLGASIVIVPLIGITLNYILGIKLVPILISLLIFVISMGVIAIYRCEIELKFEKKGILVITLPIIIIILITAYVIMVPLPGERMTEFYLLNSPKKVTVGIINHEFETINYTIEAWVVNQTGNEVNNMWFLAKRSVIVPHENKWECNFTFEIKKKANRLVFLLFKEPTEEYIYYHDYHDIAPLKLESAYRVIYLVLS